MAATFQLIPRYPHLLLARLAEADQLARALQSLSGKALASDPSFPWLLGRADEVRARVDEIVREWESGLIDTLHACDAIRLYVEAIHFALHRRYGGGFGASCCDPHLEPLDGPRTGVRRQLPSGVHEVAPEAPPASQRRSRSVLRASGTKPLATLTTRRKQAG
jgi:hypothetical protein